MVAGQILGSVAGGAGEGAKNLVGMGFSPIEDKGVDAALLEQLLASGVSPEDLMVLTQANQVIPNLLEEIFTQYRGKYGLQLEGGYIDNLIKIVDSRTDVRKKQAEDAIELLRTLSEEHNKVFLDAEKAKVAARIAPYQTAANLVSIAYGFAGIVEALSPGSARNIMNQCEQVLDRLTSKMRDTHFANPDIAPALARYSKASQNLEHENVFNGTEDAKKHYELIHKTIPIVEKLVGAVRDLSENPEHMIQTIPQSAVNAEAYGTSGAKSAASGSNGATATDLRQIAELINGSLKAKKHHVSPETVDAIARDALWADKNRDKQLTEGELDKFREGAYKGLGEVGKDAVNQALGLPADKGLIQRTWDNLKGYMPSFN